MYHEYVFVTAGDTVKLLTLGTNHHINTNLKLAGDIVWALDLVPTDSLNAGLLVGGVEDIQLVFCIQV